MNIKRLAGFVAFIYAVALALSWLFGLNAYDGLKMILAYSIGAMVIGAVVYGLDKLIRGD